MEEQTWNYSGEFLKRAKIIISDKQILLENRGLSFMRFPCRNIYSLFCMLTILVDYFSSYLYSKLTQLYIQGFLTLS